MIGKCFDEGTIQAFLDGELGQQLVEDVSRHVALCDACNASIGEAENDLAAVFSALEREFDSLVPTQRLWTKINLSIEAEARSKSIWQKAIGFLLSPTSVAFASLVIVVGLFAGLYGLKNRNESSGIVPKTSGEKVMDADIGVPSTAQITLENPLNKDDAPSSQSDRDQLTNSSPDETYRIVKTDLRPRNNSDSQKPRDIVVNEQLVGEDSYIRTIDTLEKTVDGKKDGILGSSARFAYEKDMATTSAAIDTLKDEVRRNPQNRTARELLRNSYQNKINLLNSVAEKTELMASLK